MFSRNLHQKMTSNLNYERVFCFYPHSLAVSQCLYNADYKFVTLLSLMASIINNIFFISSQTCERVSGFLPTALSPHSWLCSVSWPPKSALLLVFPPPTCEECFHYKVGYPGLDRSREAACHILLIHAQNAPSLDFE